MDSSSVIQMRLLLSWAEVLRATILESAAWGGVSLSSASDPAV